MQSLEYIKKSFNDRIIYIKVNKRFLDIIENVLRKIGKKNTINIGDIVAFDNHGYRKCLQEEIDNISPGDIIDYSNTTEKECIMVKHEP